MMLFPVHKYLGKKRLSKVIRGEDGQSDVPDLQVQ